VICHRERTDEYTRLIQTRDADGIMELLTDKAVEERVIARVALKAATFGQDIGSPPLPSSSSSGSNDETNNHISTSDCKEIPIYFSDGCSLSVCIDDIYLP
jgi:chorismate mutase